MAKSVNTKKQLNKDARIISLSIGGFYLFFGGCALLMIMFQRSMFINMSATDDELVNYFIVLYDIWNVYMPLMMGVGVLYLLFGLVYNKLPGFHFQINLILGIISLLYFIAYAITSFENIDPLIFEIPDGPEIFENIEEVFMVFGFIGSLALFTVPQFIIGYKIRKQNKANVVL